MEAPFSTTCGTELEDSDELRSLAELPTQQGYESHTQSVPPIQGTVPPHLRETAHL